MNISAFYFPKPATILCFMARLLIIKRSSSIFSSGSGKTGLYDNVSC